MGHFLYYRSLVWLVGRFFIVFNATFNNISVISWASVLLEEETGGPRKNHRPATSSIYADTKSHLRRWSEEGELPEAALTESDVTASDVTGIDVSHVTEGEICACPKVHSRAFFLLQ